MIALGAVIISQIYFIAKVYPGSSGLVCLSSSTIYNSAVPSININSHLEQIDIKEEKTFTHSIYSLSNLDRRMNYILNDSTIDYNNVKLTKNQRMKKFISTANFIINYSEVEEMCEIYVSASKKYGPTSLCQYQLDTSSTNFVTDLLYNNSRQPNTFKSPKDEEYTQANSK